MWCYSVSWIIFVLNIGFVSTEGILGQIGEAFQSEKFKDTEVRGIFLSTHAVYNLLVDAAIYRFRAYVLLVHPVRFQIWRPVRNGLQEYSLVGQVRLQPRYTDKFYNVSVPRQSPIIVKQGDILGVFNEEEGCALAYQFQPSGKSGSWHSDREEGVTIATGERRMFDSMLLPYTFSVEAFYDTDTLKYLGPFESESTTEENELEGQTEEIPVVSGNLNYTGNSLANRDQIMLKDARAMYLFPGIRFTDGVVVEFHAFFGKKQQVVFQIWRQYSADSYALVGSYVHLPQNVPAYERVTLSLGSFIFVQDRDILGVAFLSNVGPIAYRMTGFEGDSGPHVSSIVNNRLPSTGEIVKFGTTHLPYDFAVGAIYDTDTDPTKYGEPPSSVVPEYPSSPTAAPFTPFSIELPSDHLLLGDTYLYRAPSVMSKDAQRSFILSDITFPSPGLVVAFHAYVVQPGRLYFQIWRQYKNSGKHFELIGQKGINFEVSGVDNFEPRLVEIILEDDEQIHVLQDDLIGFANGQNTSVIGYQFTSTSTFSSPVGINAAIGEVITFDDLPLPYKFSLAVTFKRDEVTTQLNGLESSSIDDVTEGRSSIDDVTEGPLVGKLVDTTESFSWIMDAKILFGLLIWLIILTVLFFMLLACFLCGIHRKPSVQDENKRPSFLYDYQSKNSVARTPSDYLTHSPNKENDVLSYFNPKTGSRSGPVMRNDSMREQLIGSDDTDDNKYGASGNVNNNNKRPESVYSDYSDGTVTVITHHGDLHTHM